jgi:hypothetical protein
MKIQMTLLGTLATAIGFAQRSAGQELERVFSPQSYAAVGTATDYERGPAPFARTGTTPPPMAFVPLPIYCAPGPMPTGNFAPSYNGGAYEDIAPDQLVPGPSLSSESTP